MAAKRTRLTSIVNSGVFDVVVPFLEDPRYVRATCRALRYLFQAKLYYQIELKAGRPDGTGATLQVLPGQELLMVSDFDLVPGPLPHVTGLTITAQNAPPEFHRHFPSMRALTCEGPYPPILQCLPSFLGRLTSLNLSGHELGEASFDAPGLRHIDLSWCSVPEGWRVPLPSGLTTLSVRSTFIDLEGATFPHLTHLDMQDCPMDCLPTAPNLLYLNCAFNYPSPELLDSIPCSVVYVNLSNGEVDGFFDYDHTLILDVSHLTKLKYLATCGVTQRVIPQSVEVVRIGNYITPTMRNALDESLCVVLMMDATLEPEEDDVSGWNGGWDQVPRDGGRYLR